MRRPVALATLAAALLLVPAAPAAAACPHASESLRERLDAADGAILGRFVRHSGGLRIYRVDAQVKGRFGTRVRVRAARKGRWIGLLLDRRDGRWRTASRSPKPGALLKAAGIGP